MKYDTISDRVIYKESEPIVNKIDNVYGNENPKSHWNDGVWSMLGKTINRGVISYVGGMNDPPKMHMFESHVETRTRWQIWNELGLVSNLNINNRNLNQ